MNKHEIAKLAAEAWTEFANGGRSAERPLNMVCQCKKHKSAWAKVSQPDFIKFAEESGLNCTDGAEMKKLMHLIQDAIA